MYKRFIHNVQTLYRGTPKSTCNPRLFASHSTGPTVLVRSGAETTGGNGSCLKTIQTDDNNIVIFNSPPVKTGFVDLQNVTFYFSDFEHFQKKSTNHCADNKRPPGHSSAQKRGGGYIWNYMNSQIYKYILN